VAAGQAGELVQAAVKAHRAMLEPASRLTGAHCRRPSLLPGRSRGHVLAHWARHADGQSRMLAAALRGVVTAQYPGGDVQRAAETGAGAARPARVIFDDARAAISRPQDPRQQMPASAGERPAAARAALDRAPRAPMGVTGAATRTTTPGTPALPAQQQHRNVAITR
jgi:maleylpyruvate isomerase